MTKRKLYFFVDEAGDSTFYNKYGRFIVGEEGCSKILILGFIKTFTPHFIRKKLQELHKVIAEDSYLKNIPSIKNTNKLFHAKDDCPEVREKVYKLLINLDFKAEFVVARKIEDIFLENHMGNENIFYDDLITNLFQNKLHKSKKNIIYFAVRGNKNRQIPIENAIKEAVKNFETMYKKKVNSKNIIYPQNSVGENCLEVIYYMNWALQRAIIKKEDRYYKFIESKIDLIWDIYDFTKYSKNFYSRKNKFSIEKIPVI